MKYDELPVDARRTMARAISERVGISYEQARRRMKLWHHLRWHEPIQNGRHLRASLSPAQAHPWRKGVIGKADKRSYPPTNGSK